VPTKEPLKRSFQLHHGITLSVLHTTHVPVHAIEQFLEAALDYFQKHREEAAKTLRGYEGHWQSQIASGRKVHGTAQVFHPGDAQGNLLQIGLWVKSVAVAYSAANTLAQIKNDLAAYQAMTQPDDWLAEVLAALQKRNGDMDAFDLMMQHQLKTQSA
jgi:hypothetical protein